LIAVTERTNIKPTPPTMSMVGSEMPESGRVVGDATGVAVAIGVAVWAFVSGANSIKENTRAITTNTVFTSL
jgi:hypothetical protein